MGDEIDLLAIHFAGARANPESSNALPQRYYGDPANFIQIRGNMGKSTAIKQESEAFESLAPFDKLLTIWTNWVALSDRVRPDGDGNLQDTKDFMRTGEAVEVMINSLPRHQWWAIRKHRGISTVWLFPNLSLLDALEQAKQTLIPKMQNHIATRRYFD